jgi:hypothetical protein
MVKKKVKGLRDLGLDHAFDEDDQQERDEEIYISKREPSGYEVKKRPPVDYSFYWKSIDKTAEFFNDAGYNLNSINYDLQTSGQLRIGKNTGAEKFFQRVDLGKSPILVKIDAMIRKRAWEYYKDDKDIERKRAREYLVYHLDLESVNWLGARITASIDNEGIAEEPREQLIVNVDENGQQQGHFKYVGTRKKHYLPWSRKLVDSIISKYKADKNEILYYGFIPDNNVSLATGYKCNIYTYEQFVSTDWEQFVEIGRRWKEKTEIDRKNNPPGLLNKGIM